MNWNNGSVIITMPPITGWHCGCGRFVPNGATHRCGEVVPSGDVVAVGWRCPSCKSVWGPQVDGCKVCNKSEINL